jgi:hypothetical protein
MQSALGLDLGEVTHIPLWAVALVFAGFAPFCARAWGQFLERRVRERSARLLATFAERVADTGVAS